MTRRFTLFILFGIVLGVLAGAACHGMIHDPKALKDAAGYFGLITFVFLCLIKMIIAPLVFSTLVGGIAHMGAGSAVGRVGLKTIGWFMTASLISLLLGAGMVSLLQPGAGLHMTAAAPVHVAGAAVQASLSLKDFLSHVFPTSIADAMAKNEILQIVVFATVAGCAMAALGEETAGLLSLVEQVSKTMLKMTGYVMQLAPLAVFAAVAGSVTENGLGILLTYAALIGGFYLTLVIFWALLFGAAAVVLRGRIGGLLRAVRQPALIAFATATSEAAYPRTLEALQAFGVSKRVASFVLPLGYSFNLDGSMLYCTFASLFVAQAFGIHMPPGQVAMLILTLFVTSKGIAGVPRAALVVTAATLPAFHLPQEAGVALLLGAEHFLDMGRTCTNVIGNAVASAVVGKWENELGPERTVAEVEG